MNWATIEKEVVLNTARSGGAGGQHVNKVESKVELVWLPLDSAGLSNEEKRRLKYHLDKKLDRNQQLRIVEQRDRSQHKNRKYALERLKALIVKNIVPIPKKRVATAFVANDKKRRAWKERHSDKKANRRKIDWLR